MEQDLAWSTVTWPQPKTGEHCPHWEATSAGVFEGAPAGHWEEGTERQAKQAPVSRGVSVDPVPLRETVWGLPVASSEIERVPFSGPEPPGVNVTPMIQAALDAKLGRQLFVSAKPLLAAISPMFSARAPLLVSTTNIAGLVVPTSWVPKVTPATDRVAFGLAVRPTPFNGTDWGLLAVSSLIVRAAARGPG